MKRRKVGHFGRRVLAILLAVAFVFSGMNVTSWQVKAADETVTYDLLSGTALTETGTVEKDPYGTDLFCEHQFNDLDSVKSNLGSFSSLKFEAEVTVTSCSSGIPTVVGYAMDADFGSWKDDGAEPASLGTKVKVTVDLTSYTTMSRVGIRFTNCSAGTTVGYTINSAQIIGIKGGGTATGGSGSTGETVDGMSATVSKLSGNADWAEYNYTIKNGTTSAIKGIKVVIPFSGTVNNLQSWNCSVSKSGNNIIVKHTAEIAAGATYSCSSDTKFGFAGGATLGTPTIEKMTEEDSASGLKYTLTGQTKDVAQADTPVGKHGALHLAEMDGYSAPIIVDEAGNPFQLRGASTHGMHWAEMHPYVNKSSFQSLRDEWGVNMVRLVNYVTQGGYTQGSQAALDTYTQRGVEAAKELGMYAIVDWHIHAENPHTTKAQAKEFFKKYATMYKDYDNVIFEICNEPTGVVWYNGSGSDLYSYCKEIAQVIRDCGSNALIVCGTNTWSQDVDEVSKKPLKDDGFENILYTFHFYSGSHYDDKMNKVRTATAAGTPIFVTEFGICDASGNGNFDTANADAWIKLCDSYNISYACWSLCNKNESASYLSTSCSKTTGGWVAEDLATTGIWLVNTYRAHEEAELEKEDPAAVSRVVLNKTTLSLVKGGSETLTAIISPDTATNKKVTWTSDKLAVATVDDSGKITAVGAGTATITVTTADGNKTATCKVTVTAPSLTLNKATANLSVGDTVTLKATVSAAAGNSVIWTSDKPAVATVDDNGNVTAVAAGTAVITATLGSGADALTATCKVTVSKKKVTITAPASITVKAGTKISEILFGSSFAAKDGTTVVKGEFTWTTEDKTLTSANEGDTLTAQFTPDNTQAYDSVTDISVKVHVEKNTYENVPAAPTLSSRTYSTVTLKEVSGVEYGISADGEDYTWQTGNTFTGLSPYTSYCFAQRYPETDTYLASGAGKALQVTTYYKDADCYKVDLSKVTDAVYVEAHNGRITYDKTTNTLTLTDSKTAYTLSGSNPDITIEISGGTVILTNAALKSITSSGDTDVKITGTNTVSDGIKTEGTVTIENGNATGTAGALIVTGGHKAAVEGTDVVLKSGQITATGADSAAAVAATNTVTLTGGSLTANADVTPIQAAKIILDGCQVQSSANPVYSPDPVDAEGNPVILCKITYKDGDDNIGDPAEVNKGSVITLSNLPLKEGYKAIGWKVAGTEETLEVGAEQTISGDTTYIAIYTKIEGTLDVSVANTAALTYGYTTDSGVKVTITNHTNITIESIALALDDESKFNLSEESITNLEAGESVDVTVNLKNGMSVGNYEVGLNLTIVSGECADITKTITRTVAKTKLPKPTSKPSIADITANSITLNNMTSSDYTYQYGYKKSTDSSYIWKDSPVITGLLPYTAYDFALRYKETANASASDAGASVLATTLMSEEAKYVIDVTKLTDEDYVAAHGDTISVTGSTLVLTQDGTYTITGKKTDITVSASKDAVIILDNAEIASMEGSGNLTIQLTGTSKIISTTKDTSAVAVPGTVTIEKCEDAISGDVTIRGGAGAAGIVAEKVVIKNGTVTIEGGTGAAGIKANQVTILDGSIKITGYGDKPAIDAANQDIKVTIEQKNGDSYKPGGSGGDDTGKNPGDTPNPSNPPQTSTGNEPVSSDTGNANEKDDDKDEEIIVPALTAANILIQKGKTYKLTTNHEDVEITRITYSNSKSKKLVKVSASGKIKAKKNGTAKLKVTYEYDGVSYNKTVTVKVQKNPVFALTKQTASVTLKRKAKCNLVNPSNMLSAKGMKFKTSNKKVVTVTSKGLVTAKKKGKAKITITLNKKKYTVNVKIK